MGMRIAVLFLASSSLVQACSCFTFNVWFAAKHAEIIFRGRVVGFRDTGGGKQAVVFSVDRVWKGDLHEKFEMPAIRESTGCGGFWPDFLEPGNKLLVYAFRFNQKGEYYTSICSRTALAKTSFDPLFLGWGRKPRSSSLMLQLERK
jgi:hypothetical protein